MIFPGDIVELKDGRMIRVTETDEAKTIDGFLLDPDLLVNEIIKIPRDEVERVAVVSYWPIRIQQQDNSNEGYP